MVFGLKKNETEQFYGKLMDFRQLVQVDIRFENSTTLARGASNLMKAIDNFKPKAGEKVINAQTARIKALLVQLIGASLRVKSQSELDNSSIRPLCTQISKELDTLTSQLHGYLNEASRLAS
jgi:hypothetical protein